MLQGIHIDRKTVGGRILKMTNGTQTPPTPPIPQTPPTPATPQAPQPPQKKGLSPLAWVAIGCGALILIVVLVLVAGGLFVAHKVKQAGIDPALWKSNPTLAASKMITVVNPDLEVVKVDKDNGIITVKDKKSGKVVTLNLKDVEKGRINIEAGEEGKTSKITINSGQGEGAGSIKVTDESGKAVVDISSSTKAKTPDWVPVYPGAEPEIGRAHV